MKILEFFSILYKWDAGIYSFYNETICKKLNPSRKEMLKNSPVNSARLPHAKEDRKTSVDWLLSMIEYV